MRGVKQEIVVTNIVQETEMLEMSPRIGEQSLLVKKTSGSTRFWLEITDKTTGKAHRVTLTGPQFTGIARWLHAIRGEE